MLTVDVKYEDATRAALDGLADDLSGMAEFHQAMAAGVEETVREHLLKLNTRSPNTGFYAKAARSVESTYDAQAGTVTVPHRGAAQRFHGGRITPKTRENLAIPTDNVPVRGDERMRPGEFDDLAYLPRKGSAKPNVTGYLLEGVMNKKGTRLVPKPGGKLMFVLLSETNQLEDPSVLPDNATLTRSAAEAGEDYLQATMREKGLI